MKLPTKPAIVPSAMRSPAVTQRKNSVEKRFEFPPVLIPRAFAQRLRELELISFSWEDRNASWFGHVLTFSPSQRACFKVLWDNLFKGNLPIPNERILCGVSGTTTHVYHYFKRHDAWKHQIIVGDGRGNFWLRLPSQSDLMDDRMTLVFLPSRPRSVGGVSLQHPQEKKLLASGRENP